MSASDENRQCLMCEQIIPSGIPEFLIIRMRPENRVIHVTCAEVVESALNEWRKKQKSNKTG